MELQIKEKQRSPFTDKLRQIRLEKGIKQWQISKLLGYKSNDYARIEGGYRPLRADHVPLLCHILGVPENTFEEVMPGQITSYENLLKHKNKPRKDKIRNPFAEKARQIRLEKNMPQWVISKKLGYKSNEYARIEGGFRQLLPDHLPLFCEILGVPPHTFDDVIQKPLKKEGFQQEIFTRFEEIREKVLKMPVREFCKILEISPHYYNQIRLGTKAITRYMQLLVHKYPETDARISYSYLVDGIINNELKLQEHCAKIEAELLGAKMKIRELQKLNKIHSDKIKDLEMIKSLVSKIVVNA